jgi:tRNA wybutosine-synthesizing protein 2
MRVRRIAKGSLAEAAHENWVDHQRRPYVAGNTAYIPVRDGCFYDCEIPERSQYFGRGYFMIGDVAVLHGRKPSHTELERIINFRHPNGVLWIRSVHDITRTPDTELLYGEVGEVQHHENGYTFLLDPQKVMYAQGNHEEKRRIANLIRKTGKTERVADMFAGIGYFAIALAGSGAFVHAMEINPVAFRYLQENIVNNGLSDRVFAVCGDSRDLLSGTYDRIVMGHFDAITMLPQALQHVHRGSIIHLHTISPVKNEIMSQVESAGFSADIHVHRVKKYRPHTWHLVQDIVIV